MNNNSISVVFADSSHAHYAQRICDLIYESALQRGTGIAKRSPEYIAAKMTGGKAVVALDGEKLIGFSYIECWGHGDFVATSGLIVDPEYRHMGLGGADQATNIRAGPTTIPVRQVIQYYDVAARDETQFAAWATRR